MSKKLFKVLTEHFFNKKNLGACSQKDGMHLYQRILNTMKWYPESFHKSTSPHNFRLVLFNGFYLTSNINRTNTKSAILTLLYFTNVLISFIYFGMILKFWKWQIKHVSTVSVQTGCLQDQRHCLKIPLTQQSRVLHYICYIFIL